MSSRTIAGLVLSPLLVMASGQAHAQSEFVYDGSDAMGLSASYNFNEDLQGPAARAGFSTKGKFDLGMSVGYFTGDNVSSKALGIGSNLFS